MTELILVLLSIISVVQTVMIIKLRRTFSSMSQDENGCVHIDALNKININNLDE